MSRIKAHQSDDESSDGSDAELDIEEELEELDEENDEEADEEDNDIDIPADAPKPLIADAAGVDIKKPAPPSVASDEKSGPHDDENDVDDAGEIIAEVDSEEEALAELEALDLQNRDRIVKKIN